MELEQGLAIANEAVFCRLGRYLNPVEAAVLRGAWLGQTYEQIADLTSYSPSYLSRTVSPQLWQMLSQALEAEVGKKNLRPRLEQYSLRQRGLGARESVGNPLSTPVSPPTVIPAPPSTARQPVVDWGEAIDVSTFYGRTTELETLTQWIQRSRCRLVTLLGMGGIGKTALSVKLAQQLAEGGSVGEWMSGRVDEWMSGRVDEWMSGSTTHPPIHPSTHPPIYPSTHLPIHPSTHPPIHPFTHIIWRSLRNAPPLDDLLIDLIAVLSQRQEVPPQSTAARISRLLYYLQQHRCLLVLDNGESILRGGAPFGQYLVGYEGYGELLRRVGEGMHQSCLVLTSREKPVEVATLEGDMLPVRTLQLPGLTLAESAGIFDAKGLRAVERDRQRLVDAYSGNPLALKIISTSIRDLFEGNIAEFLQENTTVFNGIRKLLDQHIHRLSSMEQQVMVWLAINREWVTLSQLQADLVPVVTRAKLLEALEYLGRRSLIEHSSHGFTLQPVVMEYMTERLIEAITDELFKQAEIHSSNACFHCYPLIKATAKDYIRETQLRLILQPIAQQFQRQFGSSAALEQRLLEILLGLRRSPSNLGGYSAGNLLNLMHQLQIDLTGYDFSHLTLWQAYLQDVDLHRVNLAHADLQKTVWAQSLDVTISLALNADASLVAVGCFDGTVGLWHLATGQPVLSLEAHPSWVFKVAFSPNGEILATVSMDQTVKLWHIGPLLGGTPPTLSGSGRCLKVLQGHTAGVLAVCFSPDGQWLASGGDGQTIRLWQVETGECVYTLQGHTGSIRSLAFHQLTATQLLLASGAGDGTIRVWEASALLNPAESSAPTCVRVLRGEQDLYRSVAFHPQGNVLAGCGHDAQVWLWDWKTGSCAGTLRGHTQPVAEVAFSPDGEMLVSSSEDCTINLWQVQTGQCLKTLRGHRSGIWAMELSRDGRTLVSAGSYDHSVRVWDIATGDCLKTFQGKPLGYRSVAFHPQGHLLAGCGNDDRVQLWDVENGRCLKTLRGHTDKTWAIAFSPDGQRLVTGGIDGSLRLWQINSGECLRVLRGHSHWVLDVAFDPQGRWIASGGGDLTVKLWDACTGDTLQTLRGHTAYVEAIAFHPSGDQLASCGGDLTIRLWDLKTGDTQHLLTGHTARIWAVAFSPQGNLLASAGDDHTIRLWDVESGQCRAVLTGHRATVWSVVFNADGTLLASGSSDHTIRLWDAISGDCQQVIETGDRLIASVAFCPAACSPTLASGSFNGAVQLWNVQTGDCLQVLRGDRPYEGMNITGATGLTPAQRSTLKALGAIED
jgi:WD40 repeat protein